MTMKPAPKLFSGITLSVAPLAGNTFQVLYAGTNSPGFGAGQLLAVSSIMSPAELFRFAETLRELADAFERIAGGASCSQ